MSYRNPGDIQVADPSAFMNSFEQVASKWSQYYESKAEERKKKEQAGDLALANFQKSMNYSDLVKNYGAEATNTIKSYIEDKYVKSGVFKDATSSQRQEIFDDININLIGKMQKAEKGLSLDNTDIDVSMFDDSPEFQDFLLNKNRSGAAFTIKDGSIGYKYIDTENKERFISADSIPDKLDSIKTKTQIYEGIGKQIDEYVKDIDYSYGTSDNVKPAYQKVNEQTTSLFAKMDSQDRRAYFEKAMQDAGQQEPKYAYGDFPSEMPDDEKAKALELQDKFIMSSLKKRIEDNSKVINSDKNKVVRPSQPTATQVKDQKSLQDIGATAQSFYENVSPLGYGINPAGITIGVTDLNKQNYTYGLENMGFNVIEKRGPEDEDTYEEFVVSPIGSTKKIVIRQGEQPDIVLKKLLMAKGATNQQAEQILVNARQTFKSGQETSSDLP
jgi:hypothetical protein